MSKMNTLIINGQKVADLKIVLQKRNFAVVDIAVLQRLVDGLSTASTDEIRDGIIKRLTKCYSVEQMVEIMADEVAFRRTISGLHDIDIQDLETPEPKENGTLASVPS